MMNTRKIITALAVLMLCVCAVQAQQVPDLPGPGGVDRVLKLWLRADDTTKLTLNQETLDYYRASPQNTIAWIKLLPNGQNPNATQTVVNEWRSTVGSTVYNNYPADARRRKPVYLASHYLMNYHPTVDFYQNWTGNGNYDPTSGFNTFLSTSRGAMSTGKPTNSSTFLVMNAAVKSGYGSGSDNSNVELNIYVLAWHPNQTMANTASYGNLRPGLGLKVNGNGGQPRLRVSDAVNLNRERAFSPGATTIAEYRLTGVGSDIPAGGITVGYNMLYDSNQSRISSSAVSNNWHMNGYGSLGAPSLYFGASATSHSRGFKGMISEVVQYEGTLTDDEQDAINSYFAIKYGITLRPNNTNKHPVPRMDYKFSDQRIFWAGASGGGNWVSYYNNIAAVIRDDNSHLHNRQTHSTDVGSIVHLGIPGTTGTPQLYYNGTDTGLGDLQDDEAVVVGNTNTEGVTNVKREECGSFDKVFLRKWMVNKVTNGDRHITLLIAAQNNLANAFGEGASANLQLMYNALVYGNDVVLLVADSPEKLTPDANGKLDNLIAVVPMQYINGEHQCTYTFTAQQTYFTFGYKANVNGCEGEVIFAGSKTFDWNQWTRAFTGNTFYNNANSVTTKSTAALSLGDGISVKTTVTYASGVRSSANYYPRVSTSPRGSLELTRRRDAVPVTAKVKFTKANGTATPVIPEFFISGLDSRSRQYDKVTVRGYCGNTVVYPEMSYASNPNSASYKISGNTAAVNKDRSQSATAAAGRVNVAFASGVDSVEIEYTITNRRGLLTPQTIYISPMTIKPVPPPMILNEDGLAFVKDVDRSEITTCEEERYVFYIENVNTQSKYVKFSDKLPSGLKWHELTLDSINGNPARNPLINISNFAGTDSLIINNLLVPCVSTLKFSATVKIDTNAVSQQLGSRIFDNHSTIKYTITQGGNDIEHTLLSMDRYTHEPETHFTAYWAQRRDSVSVTHHTNHHAYVPNREVEVTLTVNNHNTVDVADMYLNLDWDAGFTYISGTFEGRSPSGASVGTIVTTEELSDSSMIIANTSVGDVGFRLVPGVTVFKFKLRAPDPTHLQPEYNENGVVVNGRYATLHLNYDFTSEADDPCITESMTNTSGEMRLPYSKRTHLMSNKHITMKVRR